MKNILLASIFICITATGFSQSSKKYTRYGIRSGINITNLDFEPGPLFDNSHRNGFFFGGFAEFPLSDLMVLNTEIQWSAEGAKAEDLRADYINIPIQLRFAVGNRWMIGAGPQLGLKTWENQDGFATWSFSALGGIEYMFTDDFFVDVRAVYGFTDLLDDNSTLEATQFNIQFGVGIKL